MIHKQPRHDRDCFRRHGVIAAGRHQTAVLMKQGGLLDPGPGTLETSVGAGCGRSIESEGLLLAGIELGAP